MLYVNQTFRKTGTIISVSSIQHIFYMIHSDNFNEFNALVDLKGNAFLAQKNLKQLASVEKYRKIF